MSGNIAIASGTGAGSGSVRMATGHGGVINTGGINVTTGDRCGFFYAVLLEPVRLGRIVLVSVIGKLSQVYQVFYKQ